MTALLHGGKGEMRDRYWPRGDEDVPAVQPLSYPSLIAEWFTVGFTHFQWGTGDDQPEEESQSILERASLMQLLLYVQNATPEFVPYLNGETYTMIPWLLVPRILSPNKPAAHEGTYILNVHYGFQTREDTVHTTIGFGLLNEAYANFGILGALGLGILLGGLCGLTSSSARGTPLLSLRALLAILVASYSFQMEFAAGVLVSAMFQSAVGLLALAIIFMRRRPVQPGTSLLFE
jgi:hypothetical protein